MALWPGIRLGPYEILAPIGAGGMGEVYRAKDTRLDRTVAIKVLPAHLAGDAERRQRFEREARAVSSLNHPHICTLHDIGHQDGVAFLVMEYLEGETLAARLAKRALPIDQVLRYAIEIADALAQAHRQGVFHRDLKPSNIMLTKSGAKLLDFGLAKLAEGATGSPGESALPTMSEELTARGSILGTLQYMAPEQLERKPIDARTDIFSFGAVLYEMATRRKAFQGKTQVSLIAAILEHDPVPIASFQPMSPPVLDRVVKKCLAKEPDERWQNAYDLKSELQWMAEGGSQTALQTSIAPRRKNRELASALAAVVFFLAASAVAFVHFRERQPEVQPIRFTVSPPEKTSFGKALAVSPDGTRLALVVWSEGKQSIWIRRLNSVTAHPLAGTDGGDYPFWSPDGRFIAFFAQRKLMKIEASGGPAMTLCDAPDGARGAWNRDGVIIFPPLGGRNDGTLHRVSAEGGPSTPITAPDRVRKEDTHRWPQFLPDGHHFLYYAQSLATNHENDSICVDSLDSKPGSNNRKLLLKSHWMPAYVPAVNSPGGYLLFIREGTLMAQRFNPNRLELSGEPIAVAERVTDPSPNSLAFYSVSANGVLAYWTMGSAARQLVWFDRTGRQLGTLGEPGLYLLAPRLSPDQKRLVVEVGQRGNSDLWLFDISRKTASRFTFHPKIHRLPIWSPDGSRVVYSSNREGAFHLYEKAASGVGGEERTLKASSNALPHDWSRDGRFIVYDEAGLSFNKSDIWVLPLDEGDRKPFPFTQAEFNEAAPAFSPDGRWLAYSSDESGKKEVYVRTFTGKPMTAASGGKWLISTNGGDFPRWRGDGKELYYSAADGNLMAVDVKTGATFETGVPRPLFRTLPFTHYDVAADGQRFIVNTQVAGEKSDFVNLLVNWQAGLKR